MDRILVTGAAGEIGKVLRAGLRGRYRLLRLSDIRAMAPPAAGEETIVADLADAAAVQKLMEGIDCVVHLAGVPREAPWQTILPANVIGTYNVFEAARLGNVRRVVFASSNHASGFYRVGRRVCAEDPVRPDSRYAVSKVFGEALGRLYADKHGLSIACLRIGSFRERPASARQLRTWISHRDTVQLVRCCIDAPAFHYIVVYGVSANTRNEWRNESAELIGYSPQDDAEAFAAQIEGKLDPAGPARDFQGGEFCAMEFDGDPDKIQ